MVLRDSVHEESTNHLAICLSIGGSDSGGIIARLLVQAKDFNNRFTKIIERADSVSIETLVLEFGSLYTLCECYVLANEKWREQQELKESILAVVTDFIRILPKTEYFKKKRGNFGSKVCTFFSRALEIEDKNIFSLSMKVLDVCLQDPVENSKEIVSFFHALVGKPLAPLFLTREKVKWIVKVLDSVKGNGVWIGISEVFFLLLTDLQRAAGFDSEIRKIGFDVATHSIGQIFGEWNAHTEKSVIVKNFLEFLVDCAYEDADSYEEKTRIILKEIIEMGDGNGATISSEALEGLVQLDDRGNRVSSLEYLKSLFNLRIASHESGVARPKGDSHMNSNLDQIVEAFVALTGTALRIEKLEIVRSLVYFFSNKLTSSSTHAESSSKEAAATNMLIGATIRCLREIACRCADYAREEKTKDRKEELASNSSRKKHISFISTLVEHVSIVLISRLTSSEADQLDSAVVAALAQIAWKSADMKLFAQIVELFFNILRNPEFEANEYSSREVPAALYKIATGIVGDGGHEEKRTDLLNRALVVFNEAALSLQGTSKRLEEIQEVAAAKLGEILPVIVKLSSDEGRGVNLQKVTIKRYRNVWFHLVLFQLAKDAKSQRLHRMVKRLAVTSPPLIATGPMDMERGGEKYDFLEMELEFVSFLRQGVSSQDMQGLRAWLQQLLPRRASAIRGFYNYQVVYVLCVYACEVNRAKASGEFEQAFVYLADDAMMKTTLGGCINSVVGIVFNKFLYYVENVISSEEKRQAILQRTTQMLLVNFCSRVNRIRVASDKFIILLLEKFPQVMFNQICLGVLLDLLEVVSAACNEEAVMMAEELSVRLPSQKVTIFLPETLADRIVMLKDIRKLANNWMMTASGKAPLYSHALFQRYLIDDTSALTKGIAALDNINEGRSLAIQIGSIFRTSGQFFSNVDPSLKEEISKKGKEVTDGYGEGTRGTHEFVGELQMKRYYAGVIEGMLSVAGSLQQQPGEVSKGSTYDAIATAILRGFTDLRDKFASRKGAVGEENLATRYAEELNSCLMKVGGYFFSKKKFARNRPDDDVAASRDTANKVDSGEMHVLSDFEADLIHEAVWVPVALFFTEGAINTARSVWMWLLSDSNLRIGVRVMAELQEVWSWSIQRGIGLFSGYYVAKYKRPSQGLVTVNLEDDLRGEGRMRNHQAHLRIILFLKEIMETTSTTCRTEEQKIIADMVFLALSDATVLSMNPSSLCARFQLLIIGLKILERFSDSYPHSKSLFYRIFSVALLWFSTPSRAYTRRSRFEGECDRLTLVAFYDAIKNFKRKGGFSISKLRTMQRQRRSKRTLSRAYTKSRDRNSAVLRSQSHIDMQEKMLRTGIDVVRRISTSSRDSGSKHENRQTQRGRGAAEAHDGQEVLLVDADPDLYLLSILILYEIDHISVWRDPTGEEPAILKSAYYTSNLEGRNWETLTEVAWWHSPDVAVFLPTRFRSVSTEKYVTEALEQLVLSETLRVVHLPEAVKYLVTEKNVQQNVLELKFLMYWELSQPLDVLQFFTNKIFSQNPFIALYATNSLRNAPPKAVLNYLPQLVQAMRNDSGDFIKKYLRDASKSSPKISHLIQFSLTVEAEQATTRIENDTFPEALEELRSIITDEMDDAAQDAFKKQFGFFKSVTDISGVLKHLAPEDRKHQISLELKKIELTDSLYLPTIPDLEVVGINYDNPIPLQSHAKVPIKCSFICKEPSTFGSSEPVEREESVIFKVDDDTRQDALALQCIRLLKDVLQRSGLNLFLNPYQVIPTEPGCGMIEVVKNAKSRDQLGKATDGSLYEYFLVKFGEPSSVSFQNARRNFIQSMAAYSVASFILQIKDRHNGNIMVDNEGHVIHIDFGFIFDISPGGDIKFETAPFKLTKEMIQIMGGNIESEQFQWFIKHCCQTYLAARKHMDEFVTLVALMLNTNLPCFKARSLQNLRNRFTPDKSERQAAQYMVNKIRESYEKFTTLIYDRFQAWQNGIEY